KPAQTERSETASEALRPSPAVSDSVDAGTAVGPVATTTSPESRSAVTEPSEPRPSGIRPVAIPRERKPEMPRAEAHEPVKGPVEAQPATEGTAPAAQAEPPVKSPVEPAAKAQEAAPAPERAPAPARPAPEETTTPAGSVRS